MSSQKASTNKKPIVAVAMSGGVDSSVAAYLLKKQGFEVVGFMLKLWAPSAEFERKIENLCCDDCAVLNARKIAAQLDIPLHIIDAEKEFKKEVVDYFISEYESGRTPNPCVVCNRTIKFGFLWEKAKSLGADYLATGHYVRSRVNAASQKSKVKSQKFGAALPRLFRAEDQKKDQTYFLWDINREVIPSLVFPLGDMTKDDVRAVAREAKIHVAEKKDSQEVCFVVDGDIVGLIQKMSKKRKKKGHIANLSGDVLGTHEGLFRYTIGQRARIGDDVARNFIKAKSVKRKAQNKNSGNKKDKNFPLLTTPYPLSSSSDIPRLYVVKMDAEKNVLFVGEEKDLFTNSLVASKLNILSDTFEKKVGKKVLAQIRSGQQMQECMLMSLDQKSMTVKAKFIDPVRAVTPGQSVVFYNKSGELLGGGVIGSEE